MPAGTPYIQQQVDNLRANLIATRSSDPINLCKDPAFINAFHPKGFIYGCASQQVRMNGSPFRQALRNSLQTMQVSYQQYGGENPFNIAAPLATMIVQESDMTANDAAKYIGEDMQFSGVAASTIKRVTAGGVVETQLFQIPGVTIGEAVLPGGPDEGFVVPFDTWEQPGVPPPGEPGVVEADILIEAQERAEEDAKDMQKYLLWGLVAGGVLIGGYLLFGRKT